jgi:GNAT superfamily N-acetyltransferase
MVIHIRVATVDDVPDLFSIRTSVRENHLSMEELAGLDVTVETVAAMLQGGTACGWVAVVAGRNVGFSMARADVGDLFALFVSPGFEGQGLGTRLLFEAERWFALQGIREPWLVTGGEPGLKAVGFYERRGWVRTGIEPDGQIRFVRRG